ncbi:YfiR family protein [Noviherbaspirillum sp. 17J57-3]|uniref:YfiR family protein n=2 Tax=Noviherbaspirillum galbum TaxID=2709383 RepID=A0A6B3SIX6_9BURK|nr:YfiR family protein [Noviherbaspirillum galbum]
MAQPVPEYDLKAAFVYNFAVFTEWPQDIANENGALNICIHPASPLRQPLLALRDRQVKGRRIAIQGLNAVDGARRCHVVVLGALDRDRATQIRKILAGASVLTISDDEDVSRDGAMIALSSDANRVVFDIDTRLAKQSRLAFSSKLLRLARSVQ